MTLEQKEQRNAAAIKSLYERYREAWKTQRIPAPPRGLLVWAAGAVMQVGPHRHVIEYEHDFAEEPLFMDIEAKFFWAGIPDWRVIELHVHGDGDQVLSYGCYAGTTREGVALEPLWTADRWSFDAAGRIVHWLQVTDIGRWAQWQALNTEADYIRHVTDAFAAAGLPPRFHP